MKGETTMKQKFYLLVLVLLGMVFGSQRANAQVFDEYGNVIWLGSKIEDVVGQKVYLYILGNQEVNPVTHVVTEDKGFLAGSGSYGIQITNTTVGTRFAVEQNGGNYRFSSVILNPRNTITNYMGTNASHDDKIFIDRNDNVNWILSEETHNVTIGETTYPGYQYTFYLNHAGVQNNRYIGKNGKLTGGAGTTAPANAARICILTEKDYEAAMNNVTIGNVDLAAWIKDPTFEFFNSDGAAWEWRKLGATVEETGDLIDPYTPAANTADPDALTYVGKEDFTPDHYNGNGINNLGVRLQALPTPTSTTNFNVNKVTSWHQRNQTWMVNGVYNKPANRNNDGNVNYLSQSVYGFNLNYDSNGDGVVDIRDEFHNSNHYNNLWDHCAQYFAAEIYNEAIECSQDVKLSAVDQLRGGLYKISMEALYDDDDQGDTNLTNDKSGPNAVLFYRVETGEPGTDTYKVTYREFPIPVIRSNMIGNTTTQITRHSGVSAGRELVRDVKDYEGLYYSVNAYMYLEAKSKVRIGIRVKEAHGWTVFNNVHIYALGQTPLLVDENWEKKEGQITYYEKGERKTLPKDPYLWTTYPTDWSGYEIKDMAKPNTVYYTRTMTTGAWNTICLPFRLNASQIKAAFGSDCKLSEFKGLNGTCIEFTKAKDIANNDWDADGSSFRMEIGKPYLIKPTTGPSITTGGYKIPWSRASVDTDWVEITPPAYTFPDVTFAQTYNRDDPNDDTDLPTAIDDPKGDITFEGNFYYRTVGASTPLQENWVITGGTMYHLTNTTDVNLWATYAYLHMPKQSSAGASKFTVSFDGISDETDVIEGVVAPDGNIYSGSVYSVNGQKVANDGNIQNLSKGIYIVNGKKYVVK